MKLTPQLFPTLILALTVSLASGLARHAQAAPATALFAGGCFWCMEADFQKLDGVNEVISGFTGGTLKNPTYKGDHSGHYEAIEVSYDNSRISYQQLLDVFWKNVDPFDDGGQFCDRGPSYLSALFVNGSAQRQAAEKSRAEVEKFFDQKSVVTPILASGTFWPVEEYHQDYFKKRPLRYKFYRSRCGRDARLKELGYSP
ncbi:MAG: peptide-methionine (S)-S-oxide reductase MsrA [Pseudomonadales bacterium]|nr:peptide-methionine (S)-S-oxide reductase MsrA [Gammaproteobacteria bacterium]NNL56156.1 peptide-methionine (S)-S-oxide reductase MsrA [Pseudomonadales bacterium]